jgi:hypothetical protein
MHNKKDEMKKVTYLDIVINGASIILLIISIVVSIVPFLLDFIKTTTLTNEQIFIITGCCSGVILIFSIVLFCIGTIKRFRDIILRNNLAELDELINRFSNTSDNLNNHINNCSNRPVENLIKESYIIKKPSDFYKKLFDLREKSQSNTSIRLMNFSTTYINANDKETRESATKYFNNELSFYKEKPDTSVYKIVSIHTKEKLDELKKLVTEVERRRLRNFHVAYLNIKQLNNNIPEIISVDVLGDELLFMHPKYGRITDKANWAAMYMKSNELARIFEGYHIHLWNMIESDTSEERGFILYGKEDWGINPNIEKCWRKIQENIYGKAVIKEKSKFNIFNILKKKKETE